LAYEAARRSGSAPCVLSAADEVVVGAFLNDKIDFTEIPGIIEKVLTIHRHVANPDLREIRSIHDWATEETRRLCKAL
jgi:1-deoxy-D-xylulose-5-phosphate reductoisomerase